VTSRRKLGKVDFVVKSGFGLICSAMSRVDGLVEFICYSMRFVAHRIAFLNNVATKYLLLARCYTVRYTIINKRKNAV
jgi:hypothetical protein